MSDRVPENTAARELRAFLTDWTGLRDEAQSFVEVAHENGHYPNPIGHPMRDCPLCAASVSANRLVRTLEALDA